MDLREQGLLCNDLRFPDLWYPLYRSICTNQPNSAQDALKGVDPFGVATKSWSESYKALQIVGAISQSEDRPAIGRLTGLLKGAVHPLKEPLFRLWALMLIRSLTRKTADHWDKQAHFLLTYEYLIGRDVRYVRKDPVLAKDISDFLRTENCPVEMNIQKLTYWMMISSYLGLTVKVPGGAFTAIDPKLFSVLVDCIRGTEKVSKMPLRQFVSLLSDAVMLIPLQTRGPHPTLPNVHSLAIWQAQRAGILKLDHRGDKGHIQLTGIPSDTQVFTDIELRS